MGIGTIAWTAQDDEDRLRIDTIAQCARENGLDFFDTAERYGAKPASMIPAALAGVYTISSTCVCIIPSALPSMHTYMCAHGASMDA